MTEHQAILEDLQEFLDYKEVETVVSISGRKWYIGIKIFNSRRHEHYFSISGGCIRLGKNQGVSLADPEYKKKFYQYLKTFKRQCQRNLIIKTNGDVKK